MFCLTIATDNAAFSEDPVADSRLTRSLEVARILRKAAEHLESGGDCGRCIDSNGNAVGLFEFVDDSPAV